MSDKKKSVMRLIHEVLQSASGKAKYVASGQAGLDVAENAGVGGNLPIRSDVITDKDELGKIIRLINRQRRGGA